MFSAPELFLKSSSHHFKRDEILFGYNEHFKVNGTSKLVISSRDQEILVNQSLPFYINKTTRNRVDQWVNAHLMTSFVIIKEVTFIFMILLLFLLFFSHFLLVPSSAWLTIYSISSSSLSSSICSYYLLPPQLFNVDCTIDSPTCYHYLVYNNSTPTI